MTRDEDVGKHITTYYVPAKTHATMVLEYLANLVTKAASTRAWSISAVTELRAPSLSYDKVTHNSTFTLSVWNFGQ